MKYQVKEGNVIYHADEKYTGGQEVELDEAQALIHAQNIQVIEIKKDFDKIDNIVDVAESSSDTPDKDTRDLSSVLSTVKELIDTDTDESTSDV